MAKTLASLIPDPFFWNDSFSTFYDLLDHQDKKLFRAIYEIQKSPDDPNKLQSAVKIFEEHFSTEEAMMRNSNFIGYVDHTKQHNDFIRKMRCYQVPISEHIIYYCKDWLVFHIKGQDFMFKERLSARETEKM